MHFQYRWAQLTVANGFFKGVRNQHTKFFVLQDFIILKITRCYMQSNSVASGRILFRYITFEQVLFKFARFLFKLTRSGHILPSPIHSQEICCVDEHDCTSHQHNQLPDKITKDFKTGATSSFSRLPIFAEIKIVSKIVNYRPLGY